MEDVSWNCAPVLATRARPFRNVLLTPKSCAEKLKLPCVVVTLNVTGPVGAEILTMRPFSCTGPGGFNAGVGLVLNFQIDVPDIESAGVNRNPRRICILAPVTVIDPSQLVAAVSPTPRITRYDSPGATVVVAACSETRG